MGFRVGIPGGFDEIPVVEVQPLVMVETGPGRPLFLSYSAGEPLHLRFEDSDGEPVTMDLPGGIAPGGTVVVETETTLRWIGLERKTENPINIDIAAFPPDPQCARDLGIAAGRTLVPGIISEIDPLSTASWRATITDENTVRYQIVVPEDCGSAALIVRGDANFPMESRGDPAAELRLSGDNFETVYQIRPIGSGFDIAVPINGDKISMAVVTLPFESGITLQNLEIVSIAGSHGPLPVDTGYLVTMDRFTRDQGDYGLYSWIDRPEVTLLVFRDYATQSRYLKRLAFFAEKPGARGRLLTDGELAGRHGWNAHDYPPDTLAAFYNTAEESRFPLSEVERELRDLSEDRGLIVHGEEGWSAGNGALISIALESEPWLREVFLSHELAHAVYFLDAPWRRETERIWQSLTDEERALWRYFLAWAGYDPDDEALMRNEFQSYLLQRPIEEAKTYWGWKIYVLRGPAATLRDRILTMKPDFFVRLAEEADTAFRDLTGYRAGRFSELRLKGFDNPETGVVEPLEEAVYTPGAR